MLHLEKKVIFVSVILLSVMLALIAYSVFGLGVRLPGCETVSAPFDKGAIISKGNDLYEVHMVAKMWAFDPPEIRIKPNTTLDIFLASKDVGHGFNIENTNVNLMAIPGAINYAQVTFGQPGIYHIVCHEYCGAGHQNMAASIVVGEGEDPMIPLKLSDGSSEGKTLFTAKGCVACHSVDGNPGVGPTFKGLFGRKEKMATGEVITVNEAYVVESIKTPAAKVVMGFQTLMPVLPMTDEEIQKIITYIKTL